MQFKEQYQAAQDVAPEAARLSAALSPSPGAKALLQRAADAGSLWFKRYPDGTKWVISQADMAAIERTEKDIFAQLQALPKLAPAEEQVEINALPEDYPEQHGLPIPR